MKFQEVGTYAPEALNNPEEVQPLEIAQKSALARMNYLLGFIQKNKPELYELFVKNLQKTYSDLVNKDYLEEKYDIDDSLKELEYLKKYKQLAMNVLNYTLQLLDVPKEIDWVKEKIKVPQGNYLRSFLVPRYQNVAILSDTIGREDGINLYKIYRTEYVKVSIPESRNEYSELEGLHKDNIKDLSEGNNPGWVRIESLGENGKLYYRRDSCLYAEAIKDFPDDEFKFLSACYGDYQGTKLIWNENFVLTMDHTIAKGDLYCSCIVHDTRIDWDLTHPPEEFWESIWPLHKWQKKSE